MPTYLVTGAAGFIGARLCEVLISKGHTVVGIDNLNDYYDVRLKDHRIGGLLEDDRWTANDNPRISVYRDAGRLARGQFAFQPMDVEQLPALKQLFAEFDFTSVINLAARAGVRYSMINPHVYLSTNSHGTLNLLECQREFKVPKLVLASTSSLYAGCSTPFREDLPVNAPLSPYAASKKAAELVAHSYHKLYGIDVSVLRYFTVFGPASRPDMSIFRFIASMSAGNPIELFGDGLQARDFTYVDDIVDGTVSALKPLGYEIINLGGGMNPVSIRHVIATIERLLGRKAAIVESPFHRADMRETQADIGKADRLLGWRPRISLEDGISRCIDWHKANHEWLKNISL